MHAERILQLVAKQMGGAATMQETDELKELLSHYPEYTFYLEILQSIQTEKKPGYAEKEEHELIREAWSMLEKDLGQSMARDMGPEEAMDSPFPRFSKGKRIRQAALWTGVLLMAGGAFSIWKRAARHPATLAADRISQLSVPYGAPEKRILPDSSVVWLNAGSHFRYTENVRGNIREIHVNGEAYFQVKRDPDHPFVVYAGNIIIQVLGTEFNIKAYQDENRIEAMLISGKVQIRIAGEPDKKIVLTPHEKLTVVNQVMTLSGKEDLPKKELSFQVKEVVPLETSTPIPEVAWLQDKLAFQNEPFYELAKKLERRYAVHILCRDSSLLQERLSGVFENENIEKALKLLQMTTPFRYRLQGDSVWVNP